MNKKAIEHADKLRAAMAEVVLNKKALEAMGYDVNIVRETNGYTALIEKVTKEEL